MSGDSANARNSTPDPALLPFDHYQRYEPVAEWLATRPWGEGRRILDVGGAYGFLDRFLPHAKVIVTDGAGPVTAQQVLAQAPALPFAPKSFTWVVSIDVLEHVPCDRRAEVIASLWNVAEDGVIVACPVQSAEAEAAEQSILGIQERFALDTHFLLEHQECGLPDPAALAEEYRKLTPYVVEITNGSLLGWVAGMVLEALFLLHPDPESLQQAVRPFLNRAVFRFAHQEPAYRRIALLLKREEEYRQALQWAEARKAALFQPFDGAWNTFLQTVAGKVLAGTALGAQAGEIARLQEDIRTLTTTYRDLEGLTRTYRLKAERLDTLETLAVDLEARALAAGQALQEKDRFIRELEGEFLAAERRFQELEKSYHSLQENFLSVEQYANSLKTHLEAVEADREALRKEITRLATVEQDYHQTYEFRVKNQWRKLTGSESQE